MDKTEFISELDDFHHELIQRNKSLGLIINALSDDTQRTCVQANECHITKWLKERGHLMEKLYGADTVRELQVRHEEWHEESSRICALVKLKEQRRVKLVDKLFGKKKIPKMRQSEYDIAMVYYDQLKEVTETIDTLYERMRKRAGALSRESFNEAS